MPELAIDRRYEGIPGVSHGGYLAGLAAKELGPSVSVTLKKAVPPGSTVTLERSESQVLLRVDGDLAATAVSTQLQTTAPEAVAPKEAEQASERYQLLVEPRQTMILTQNGVPLHLTAWARAE